MVSIKDRESFYKIIESDHKVAQYYNLWFERKIEFPIFNINLTDKVYYSGLLSIRNNTIGDFANLFSELCEREPKSDDAYLYDEYLLSIIVINVLNFQLDKNWITHAIKIKRCSTDDCKNINESYLDLLEKNKIKHLNGMILEFACNNFDNNKLVNLVEIYKDISKNGLISSTVDIENILRLKCYDKFITENIQENRDKVKRLTQFENEFVRRVKIIASTVYYILCISVIYLSYGYYSDPEYKKIFEEIDVFFAVMAVLGVGGIIANILSKDKISKYIADILFGLLGYIKINNKKGI